MCDYFPNSGFEKLFRLFTRKTRNFRLQRFFLLCVVAINVRLLSKLWFWRVFSTFHAKNKEFLLTAIFFALSRVVAINVRLLSKLWFWRVISTFHGKKKEFSLISAINWFSQLASKLNWFLQAFAWLSKFFRTLRDRSMMLKRFFHTINRVFLVHYKIMFCLWCFLFYQRMCTLFKKNAISCLFLKNVSPSKRVICSILNNLQFPMVEGIAFYAQYINREYW